MLDSLLIPSVAYLFSGIACTLTHAGSGVGITAIAFAVTTTCFSLKYAKTAARGSTESESLWNPPYLRWNAIRIV